METHANRIVTFTMGGMIFEYDEEKNRKNIEKHGISFKTAARIFFDYDRIEFLMKKTVNMKNALIRLEICLQELLVYQKKQIL